MEDLCKFYAHVWALLSIKLAGIIFTQKTWNVCIQIGGIVGDGYQMAGRLTSPHTNHEMFEGLTVVRASQVCDTHCFMTRHYVRLPYLFTPYYLFRVHVACIARICMFSFYPKNLCCNSETQKLANQKIFNSFVVIQSFVNECCTPATESAIQCAIANVLCWQFLACSQ